MEELTDILVGLEQRIHAYKNRFQELEKKKRRLDDEIATIKKYLELAETLYRVEADKAKLASLSSQIITDDNKGVRTLPVMDVTDQSREILLGRSKYVGKSVPCLLYTSDAADERSSVDLGGRRIIKKKNNTKSACASSAHTTMTYLHPHKRA